MKKRILCLLLSAVFLCGCAKENTEVITLQPGVLITDNPSVKPAETMAVTTTTPVVTTTVPEPSGTVKIAFAGDTTQSDVFAEATSWRSMKYPFEDVNDIFVGADISFVNLETCVSDRGESEKKEGYGFQTPPEYLQVYTEAGIDIVSLANNHVRDFGMDALDDTFANLEAYGIGYVGAGRDVPSAEKLVLYDINGVKVGFTALNMINMDPTWYVRDDRPGINCVDFAACEEYLDLISRYDKECDVLFETFDEGMATGHTQNFIEVCVPSSLPLHSITKTVRLLSCDGNVCFGEILH